MRISFDPAKRDKALRNRGLDFADAAVVSEGTTVEVDDVRKDYGERRVICFGTLSGGLSSWVTRLEEQSTHLQHAKGK